MIAALSTVAVLGQFLCSIPLVIYFALEWGLSLGLNCTVMALVSAQTQTFKICIKLIVLSS